MQLPVAAQFAPHTPAPHTTAVHDGCPAQLSWQLAAFSQCTWLHDAGPVHCAVNDSALPPVIVPRHEPVPLHWIVHVGDIPQLIVPAQLLSAAQTSRHGTNAGHVQLSLQLMTHTPIWQLPGHVIAEHASANASGCASPPASSPIGEKPIRPHAPSAIRIVSARIASSIQNAIMFGQKLLRF